MEVLKYHSVSLRAAPPHGTSIAPLSRSKSAAPPCEDSVSSSPSPAEPVGWVASRGSQRGGILRLPEKLRLFNRKKRLGSEARSTLTPSRSSTPCPYIYTQKHWHYRKVGEWSARVARDAAPRAALVRLRAREKMDRLPSSRALRGCVPRARSREGGVRRRPRASPPGGSQVSELNGEFLLNI